MALPAGFDPVTGKFTGVISPRIQSSRNNYGSAFNLDTPGGGMTRPAPAATSTYTAPRAYARRPSVWRRFNAAIADFGNWIDDHIETFSNWITVISVVIAAIGLICWVFNDSNIFYIICRIIGACIFGGILMVLIGIQAYILGMALKIVRYVFWSGTTLLVTLGLALGIWAYVAITNNSAYEPEHIEAVVRSEAVTYECTAYELNIRSLPNTSSAVLGKISIGDQIEVLDEINGFAHITYKGQDGYLSLKYLKKIE